MKKQISKIAVACFILFSFIQLKAQPVSGDWSCPTDFGNFTFTVNSEGTRINKLIFEVVNWECGNTSGSFTTTIEWPEPNGWSISNDQFYIDRVISGEGWIVSGTFIQAGTEASGAWSYENGWGTVCSGNWGPIVVTSIKEGSDGIPQHVELAQNYPNPFNPETQINYSIPHNSFVTLEVYDILGREITTLVNEVKSPGNYEVNFNATNLPSGIYFYRLQAGSFVETKKMILLK
jgi:hypothetical protein